MTALFRTTAALAALSLPLLAQDVQVFGGKSERMSSSLLFFSDKPEGGISIAYGQPVWKDEYNQQADQAKGKLLRLGKDWWTTFDTSLKLTIGGTEVPPGSYFLGLAADEQGKFSLAFLDADKAMKSGVMPFMPNTWRVDFKVPMEFQKDSLASVVEKLTIELKGNLDKAELVLTWGKHLLRADVKIHLGGKAAAEAKGPAKKPEKADK